jgi:hypothetical protein
MTGRVPDHVCRKYRYASEEEAQITLDHIVVKAHKKPQRQECRLYRCETCKGWHLTAMPLGVLS